MEHQVPANSVQYAAGFRLLDKFKMQWEILHGASETNVHKTKIVVDKLNSIEQSCSRQLAAIENFNSSFKCLSKLDEQIVIIEGDLKKLEESFSMLENRLTSLILLKEQQAADEFIRNCKGNYRAMAQKAKIQSEVRRDQLMLEHLMRVQASDQKRQ